MKKLVLLALLLFLPSSAEAFSTSQRAAAADIVYGATKPYQTTIGMTTLQCANSGCAAVVHLNMPMEATGPELTVHLRRTSSDPAPVGAVCDQVCAMVAFGGQDLVRATDPAQWACTPYTNDTLGGQWTLLQRDFAGALTPKFYVSGAYHDCGSLLSPTECNGGELYIIIQRNAYGACASGSANVVDYTSVTVDFQ